MKRLACLLLAVCSGVVLLVTCFQRRLLYFPTHRNDSALAAGTGQTRWLIDGRYVGQARLVENPRHVWLFAHGNGGQASDSAYAHAHFSPEDAIFSLEYPGYGERPGSPTRKRINTAAEEANSWLVARYGWARVGVIGESLGSGPVSHLATLPRPPRHIVLVVPFDSIVDVAAEHYPFLPVRLLMLDRWDNVAALKGFTGRLEIFGATQDTVIPVHHARRLAASIPGARYHEFAGDHGWSDCPTIRFAGL